MPFSFNEVELCVVTINEKPWRSAKEVHRVLEYGKATKAADIVKHLCSRENYAHKYQLSEFVYETNSWIGLRTREKMTITSVKKVCMR